MCDSEPVSYVLYVPQHLRNNFTGIGAAMTVPSALSLIVEWFPEPKEQNQAIAFFGGASGLGNSECGGCFKIHLFALLKVLTVLGIILGGIFVQWATWRWILYFTGIVGLGIAVATILFVPLSAPRKYKPSWKRLDLIGVTLITGKLHFVDRRYLRLTQLTANESCPHPLRLWRYIRLCERLGIIKCRRLDCDSSSYGHRLLHRRGEARGAYGLSTSQSVEV